MHRSTSTDSVLGLQFHPYSVGNKRTFSDYDTPFMVSRSGAVVYMEVRTRVIQSIQCSSHVDTGLRCFFCNHYVRAYSNSALTINIERTLIDNTHTLYPYGYMYFFEAVVPSERVTFGYDNPAVATPGDTLDICLGCRSISMIDQVEPCIVKDGYNDLYQFDKKQLDVERDNCINGTPPPLKRKKCNTPDLPPLRASIEYLTSSTELESDQDQEVVEDNLVVVYASQSDPVVGKPESFEAAGWSSSEIADLIACLTP